MQEGVVGDIGIPELLVILGIALLVFGPRRLGDLGKGLGEGIRGFKNAISGRDSEPAKLEVKAEVKTEAKSEAKSEEKPTEVKPA